MAFARVAARLLFGLGAVVAALSVFASLAAAVPGLPANTGCGGAAVVAKLSVLEDRAAANMLAEALDTLDQRSDSRCLVDAGSPADGAAPPAGARAAVSGASTVYVVGGPAAVPDAWLRDRLGLVSFVRVAGPNRWDTQANVAAAIISLSRGQAVSAYDPAQASRGSPPPNGGCSGPAVLAKLGVREDRAAANMLAETYAAIASGSGGRCLVDVGDPAVSQAPSSQSIGAARRTSSQTVVGGAAAIPESWLRTYFQVSGSDRVSGADRWATQTAVAKRIVSLAQGGVASGTPPPDTNTYTPPGTYTTVSAGNGHSCGVRTDNTITCWGYNYYGQADAPSGSFQSVSAGGFHSCGVRTDNTITCWGINGYGQADAPSGSFQSVSAGWSHSCGVRTDNTITCWFRFFFE